MNEDGALFDSGFDGVKPFRDTPEAGGISLESALRDFGPAALDDLIPRILAIAAELDAAHAAGAVHGALHPSKVIITDDATSLISGTSSSSPYLAPEVADGEPATPASDQYSLAAIAYEWLFGRPVERTAGRPVEVRNMPGVDRAALSKAFTRALSPNPEDRFGSCTEFCKAVSNTAVPELPLLAFEAEDVVEIAPAPVVAAGAPQAVEDLADDIRPAPDFDAFDATRAEPEVERPVEAWQPAAAMTPPTARSHGAARFGGGALILAAVVGAIFGFAGGYMARPRALQTGAPQEIAAPRDTEAPVQAGEAGRAGRAGESRDASSRPAPPAQPASPVPSAKGQLLVRSNPSGASVKVDGVDKGVTPLTLRDVEFGTRAIIVSRPGYTNESRTIAITAQRPSRSLDVRLAAAPAVPAKRPAPVTAAPKPAAATGALLVESRPTGAAVQIDGVSRGTTPLAISDLPPGDYRVVLSMAGFRNFATTVRVVAGERVRAAASLTAQEQE